VYFTHSGKSFPEFFFSIYFINSRSFDLKKFTDNLEITLKKDKIIILKNFRVQVQIEEVLEAIAQWWCSGVGRILPPLQIPSSCTSIIYRKIQIYP